MEQLSQQGIQQKINALYNLSDTDLMEEAKKMCADFMAWLNDNFELTPEQELYFKGVPETLLFGWGAQFAGLIITRGAINLDVSDPPETRRTKQIRTQTTIEFDFDPDNTLVLSGNGALTAVYKD